MNAHPQIGFIGTGVMGASMVRHLMKAGYPLSVHTRTKARADDLIDAGAEWCDSVGELAQRSDIVITIVGFPEDVEACYFGDDGIIARAREGALLIDMTTSSPALARPDSERSGRPRNGGGRRAGLRG